MKDKQFDNVFKEKLQSYSSPVPEDMWERIAQDKRKKKPLVFWFTNTSYGLYGFLAITIIIAGVFAWNHNSINGLDTISLNTGTSINKFKTNPLNETNNIIHKQVKSQPIANSPVYKTDITSNSVVNKNSINIKSEITNVSVTENDAPTTATESKQVNINSILSSTKNKQIKSYLNKYIGNKAVKDNNLHTEIQNSILPVSINSFEGENDNSDTRSLGQIALQRSDKFKMALSKLNVTLKKTNHFDCPGEKSRINKSWYVEIYGSPEFNFKTVTNIGTTSNYLKKKDSAESMLMGFNFGVRLMKNIFSNIYIKTGVQLTQYNEKFSVQREDEHKTTTVVTNKIISLPQGDTTISDTSVYTQVGYKYTKTINQYRNIEVPIILCLRSENVDDIWCWSVSGGVILNAYSWNSGSTIDTSLGIVPISTKGSGAYSSAFGLSLMAAASIERKLNDNWALFTEPYFRYGLSNKIISKFGFEQKFNSLGISLGIRYKFGNRQQY